jgi:hypothetical protein
MGLNDVKFPFDPSESDIIVALAQYFKELGFESHEMRFEDSFSIKLGHTSIRVDKPTNQKTVHGRNDLLLTRSGQPLVMIEAKAPNVAISDEDRDQGLSYARLLREMPPYTAVTNGQDLYVYDTITANLIDSGSPVNSCWWENDCSYDGLSRVDKDWAAKTLFALDYSIVQKFCNKQVELNIVDIKGENRRYWPKLYTSRQTIKTRFRDFLNSDKSCFAVIGHSGSGKTNELCALVETLNQKEKPVTLFYTGPQLKDGLFEAIRYDFEWEFKNKTSASQIIKRLSEILQNHQAQMIVFVDGLDETFGSLENVKNELLEFTKRIDPAHFRLCISCKAFDWDTFVFDRDQNLNFLGRQVFSDTPADDTNLPGLFLPNFNEVELEIAWSQYRETFNITGGLTGETRQVCQNPLMLRLVSEIYTNTLSPIPSQLSNINVFNLYWERKMGEIISRQEKNGAAKILGVAAKLMIEADKTELSESEFYGQLDQQRMTNHLYDKLIRLGMLVLHEKPEISLISFPFEKIRSYVFTIKTREWQEKFRNKKKMSSEVRDAMATRLGRDAVLFYLASSDVDWLLLLIDSDFELFIQIMKTLDREGVQQEIVFASAPTDFMQELRERIENFVVAYSKLRDKFPSLKNRLSPFTRKDVGILVFKDFHCLRGLSSKYPERVLVINEDEFLQLMPGQITEDIYHDYLPSGDLTNALCSELSYSLPAFHAFKVLCSHLANLITNRLLDESTCPKILSERVDEILQTRINPSIPGSPRGHFWELLNYASLNDAQISTCFELKIRTKKLLENWISEMEISSPPISRWYQFRIPAVWLLKWYLEQIESISETLILPERNSMGLFSLRFHGEMELASELALDRALTILNNYRELVKKNFPELLTSFATYQHLDKRLLIEVLPLGDFTFVWLPSAPSGPPIVRFIDRETNPLGEFISGRPEEHTMFRGIRATDDSSISYIKSDLPIQNIEYTHVGFMKGIELEIHLDGELFRDSNAIISPVRFRNRFSISESVYQLLVNEIGLVFGEEIRQELNRGDLNRSMSYSFDERAKEAMKFAINTPDQRGLQISSIHSMGRRFPVPGINLMLSDLYI